MLFSSMLLRLPDGARLAHVRAEVASLDGTTHVDVLRSP